MIRNWFFTKKWLIAELDYANVQITGFVTEAIELGEQVEDLREQVLMATRTARLARGGDRAWSRVDPARYLNAAERAELTRLRDLEYEMTTRLANLRGGDSHV